MVIFAPNLYYMSDLTPLLKEMLQQMRDILSRDDLRAGLPLQSSAQVDVSPLLAQWVSMQSDYQRQQQMIADLDADIERMQPWGDFPMQRIDQLSSQGLQLQFWKAPLSVLSAHPEWVDGYQLEQVSSDGKNVWFTVVAPTDVLVQLPGAQQQEVPPSPLSTLIMLQTRAKDASRETLIKMGDFALEHYLVIESALGLSGTLPPVTKRARVRAKLKRIFVHK